MSSPEQRHGAADGAAQAGRPPRPARVWPLPSTPAMPRISPARTSSDTPRRPAAAVVVHAQVVDASTTPPGAPAPSPGRASTCAADHHLAPAARGVASRGVVVPTSLPAAQDADPVGDREHLAQLVGDEDDRRCPPRPARA